MGTTGGSAWHFLTCRVTAYCVESVTGRTTVILEGEGSPLFTLSKVGVDIGSEAPDIGTSDIVLGKASNNTF